MVPQEQSMAAEIGYCALETEHSPQESILERWQNVIAGIRDEYVDDTQVYPWVIGFSGGKDSTVVAQGVFEALLTVPPSKRTRSVHIVSNDTMVESPLVIAHLDDVTQSINQAAINLGLPVIVSRTNNAALT